MRMSHDTISSYADLRQDEALTDQVRKDAQTLAKREWLEIWQVANEMDLGGKWLETWHNVGGAWTLAKVNHK